MIRAKGIVEMKAMSSAYFRFFLVVFVSCAVFSLGTEFAQAQVSSKTGEEVSESRNSGEESEQGQDTNETSQTSCDPDRDYFYMVITEIILIVLILFVLPLFSYCQNKQGKIAPESIRGLGLPSGSIRGMLALLIVGSMVNLLLFGHCALLDDTKFDAVLDAFTAISMAVIAFYFANRSSTPKPSK